MKVLITGANGLLGQALGQELVRRGHDINALVRDPGRAEGGMSYPCRLFKWDSDQAVPASALDGVDAIVHLAGESIAGARWTEAKKKAIRESRVEGTRALVAAIAERPEVQKRLKCFVQSSAVGYYGECGDELVGESAAAGHDFLASVCQEWEAAGAEIKTASPSTRHVSVRTGIVMSEKGGALQPLLKLFSNGGGATLSKGGQWMSWIHLDDIVGLYVLAVESDLEGPINAVAPNPVTNHDFTRALADSVHQWVLPSVPAVVLKLTLGEMSTMILTSTRASSARAHELGYRFKFADLRPALAEICRDMQAGSSILASEQWVPAALGEVFRYFSSAQNLEELTPEYLHFKIKSVSTEPLQTGSLIDYALKLHGVPLHWKTRIEQWRPPVDGEATAEFSDLQLEGPYHQWHHTHVFETLGKGTLIRDRVVYKLPLGAPGRVVAGMKVASDVKEIFDFRRRKIAELF